MAHKTPSNVKMTKSLYNSNTEERVQRGSQRNRSVDPGQKTRSKIQKKSSQVRNRKTPAQRKKASEKTLIKDMKSFNPGNRR